MNSLGVIIFFLNVVLLLLVTHKINCLRDELAQYRKIEANVAAMVDRHLQLADLVLEELDGKINEAGTALPKSMENDQTAGQKETGRSDNEAVAANKKRSLRNEAGPKIVHLRQQGYSVQEIAERLSISQGEIALKLNLYEKLAAGQRKERG